MLTPRTGDMWGLGVVLLDLVCGGPAALLTAPQLGGRPAPLEAVQRLLAHQLGSHLQQVRLIHCLPDAARGSGQRLSCLGVRSSIEIFDISSSSPRTHPVIVSAAGSLTLHAAFVAIATES